ncbi:peptide/nickel transport system permease protein [Pseudonocardia thermophila]|uniref:Peptide/nickel transport system permease protein n=1 Tax=Pseudonocardia thermophila TaxID=1848 RepID=A0A1M6XQA4_PSETH|nr:ABC transporter permease [Pseudonocardia thermophila]SHL08141.1 peptide/nickel transport system permease protein [Pseudonocardia thermophila]
MVPLVARRVLITVPLVVVVSFLVFLMIDLVPGDPAVKLAGENASAERIEAIREQLHLADPLLTRYLTWLGGSVTGDLGRSFVTNQEVGGLLWTALGATASLVLVTAVLMVVIGLVLGITAAVNHGRAADRIVVALCSVLVATPSFWLALLLVVFFAVDYAIFPAIGFVPLTEDPARWLYHLVLPGLALSARPSAELTLQLRAALTEVLQRDFVTAASARGLTRAQIVGKHALKNAAVPAVTVLGFRLAEIIGGAVVIETVFSLPGLGPLMVQSVLGGDVPVILGIVVLTMLWVALFNLLTDLSYLYLNPKART